MERSSMERAMSTELIMDIVLDHLKVKDLLNYRFVSKFWNKAASSVLRKRSTMIKKISTKKNLMELQKCMKQSSDFPFAGLSFAEPWKMTAAGEMKFFKNYGARFTSLALDTRSTNRLQGLAPFIYHLPRLSILQLGHRARRLPPQFLDSADDGRILNLPSLRTLRISSPGNEGVLRDMFTAASSLLRIECHTNATYLYEVLRALKETGKLQAVTSLIVDVDKDDETAVMNPDDLLLSEAHSLTKLHLGAGNYISDNGVVELLLSSQHTLKYLSLDDKFPHQFSSKCPVLAKLTALSLRKYSESSKYVFEGGHGYKFPALKELKLFAKRSSISAKWSDGLFTVPSLTKIELDGQVGKTGIENLARSFPNVIEILLGDRCGKDYTWSWNGKLGDIWSVRAFKFLEKLTIWGWSINNYRNMDVFLTGMSSSICKNLRKHAQQNLSDTLFNEILRESPSILQLKNLKELVICVIAGRESFPGKPPFISMVSLWYALDMMPNLDARFVYEHSSPSKRFQEKNRDIAVTTLNAAFKHVESYVNLEPFFY